MHLFERSNARNIEVACQARLHLSVFKFRRQSFSYLFATLTGRSNQIEVEEKTSNLIFVRDWITFLLYVSWQLWTCEVKRIFKVHLDMHFERVV